MASHQRFKKKYDLPFTLLADVDGDLCTAFGVPDETGSKRSTFLLDGSGKVLRAWPKVSVGGHAAEVLSAIP